MLLWVDSNLAHITQARAQALVGNLITISQSIESSKCVWMELILNALTIPEQ